MENVVDPYGSSNIASHSLSRSSANASAIPVASNKTSEPANAANVFLVSAAIINTTEALNSVFGTASCRNPARCA
ncbi:MAG: hypothetical protein BWY67_01818 [Bacteroidetes bacterium ADurb.Bin397]|nr:MAG: hypothetical protein BWY67_01818 [Bacteroidetes bacterium ADurb.Bin397]